MFNMLNLLMLQAETADQPLLLPDSVQKANFAQAVDKLVNTDYHQLIANFAEEAVWVLVKILCALAIWAVGRIIIRWVLGMLNRTFERRNVDTSLRSFLRNLIKVVLTLLVILTVVQMLGVNVTSIIALFASATLAIGMALSGTMQNFAGGVMILLLKPYRVGDYISAQGQSGTVTEIMLFSTKIQTTDNQTIYIPNSSIATAIIDNYSAAELRRVDITVGISYGDSVEAARQAILELCREDGRILSSPEPAVWLAHLGDSSVILTVRMWVKNADYWDVFFQMNEKIYDTLPKKGINFPFPQMDVHVKKEE
ncbi:MAG: mechanosensitive ion channel [Alistipes sp.]|nr:mechanosensitive ion channel [Alistipes sp.]